MVWIISITRREPLSIVIDQFYAVCICVGTW